MINHNSTSENTYCKDNNNLVIECTLIGGFMPMMEVYYQNRKITSFFERKIWNDRKALEQLAKEIIEQCHTSKPFKK
jgi:hypothetical protein